MSNLINELLKAAHHYTVVDFGIYKICLFTFGILFGTYFYTFFEKHILVFWIIAILAWLFIMIQTIRYIRKP